MEGDRLSGGIAPLIFKLCSRHMIVVRLSALATLLPEKNCGFHGVGGWVGAGAGLDVLGRRLFYFFCQVLNYRYSSIYPSHFTDCAAHTDLKIIQKSV